MKFTGTISLPKGLKLPSQNDMYTWHLGKVKKKATVVRFEEKVQKLLDSNQAGLHETAPKFPAKVPLRLELLLKIHNAGKRDIDNHTKSLIDAISKYLGINDARFYEFILKKERAHSFELETIQITVENIQPNL